MRSIYYCIILFFLVTGDGGADLQGVVSWLGRDLDGVPSAPIRGDSGVEATIRSACLMNSCGIVRLGARDGIVDSTGA